MSHVRRSIGFSIVVLLSCVLPIFVVVGSVYSFVVSGTEPFEIAALKNGEMWFTEYRSTGFFESPISYDLQIKSRNLATGIEQTWKSDQPIGYGGTPLWVGDDFYFNSGMAIYQRAETTYKSTALSLKYIVPLPTTPTGNPNQPVFVYQGELTTVVEDKESNSRLVHLREGHWVDGRKIRRPPLNCHWHKNPADGRNMFEPWIPQDYGKFKMGVSFGSTRLPTLMVPFASNTIVGIAPASTPPLAIAALTAPIPPTSPDISVSPAPQSEEPVTLLVTDPETVPPLGMDVPFGVAAWSNSWTMNVQQIGEHVHVLYTTDGGFCAYREGFEFDDEAQEGVSALIAENVIRDANGWEPIQIIPTGQYTIQHMVCDHDGAVFSSLAGPLIRRNLAGKWTNIAGFKNLDPSSNEFNWTNSAPRLIVDSSEGIIYVADDSGEVLRVEGNSMQPTNFKVPDYLSIYLARWKWLFLGLSAAWLLHYAVVAIGTGLLVRNNASVGLEDSTQPAEAGKGLRKRNATSAAYEFGNQKVTLASTGRRGLALSIDLAILAIVFSGSVWVHSRLLGLNSAPSNQREYFNSLMMLESTLMYDSWQDISMMVDSLIEILSLFTIKIQDESLAITLMVLIAVLIDTGLILWLLKIFDEARFGSTPGKRLLGIRTVRTTLRPCGFARAMVRDLLSLVDLLGFLTPIPAAASMVYSPARQRLADRVADTIVINAMKPHG